MNVVRRSFTDLRIYPVIRPFLTFGSEGNIMHLYTRRFKVFSVGRIAAKQTQDETVQNVKKERNELKHISEKTLNKRYSLLLSNGFTEDFIFQHPQLLLRSADSALHFMNALKAIGIHEAVIAHMLNWKDSLLSKCILTCTRDIRNHGEHRIDLFASQLKSSPEVITAHLQKYPFLLSLSFEQLRNVIKVLLDNGIKAEDILSDPWVLRTKTDFIMSRIKRLDVAEVENKKPWMTRCTDEIFESFLSRISKKQKLLGELSLEEYLSQRLGYSAFNIKEIIDRETQLQKTGVLKMKRILDFLFASGFTSSQILAGLPRVANRRIETIHCRLLELHQLGIPPSLYVLCKSKKEYLHYISKWKTCSRTQ